MANGDSQETDPLVDAAAMQLLLEQSEKARAEKARADKELPYSWQQPVRLEPTHQDVDMGRLLKEAALAGGMGSAVAGTAGRAMIPYELPPPPPSVLGPEMPSYSQLPPEARRAVETSINDKVYLAMQREDWANRAKERLPPKSYFERLMAQKMRDSAERDWADLQWKDSPLHGKGALLTAPNEMRGNFLGLPDEQTATPEGRAWREARDRFNELRAKGVLDPENKVALQAAANVAPQPSRLARMGAGAGRFAKAALSPVNIAADLLLGSAVGAGSAGLGYASAAPGTGGLFTPPGPGYEGVVTSEGMERVAEQEEVRKEEYKTSLLREWIDRDGIEDVLYSLPVGTTLETVRLEDVQRATMARDKPWREGR